ncbi:hypothetical protein BB560_003188 [Smittium megazygosporum]|uniref:Uncharacterized protein n=1 Tax=Smittium megazygosporum TaxID=133381 RepID=A0A2T9ZCP0_9FUNG|nr:hypothetical protein BB560_003188 [Smittium megazygosporum]
MDYIQEQNILGLASETMRTLESPLIDGYVTLSKDYNFANSFENKTIHENYSENKRHFSLKECQNRMAFSLSISPTASKNFILNSKKRSLSENIDFYDSSIWNPNSISPSISKTAFDLDGNENGYENGNKNEMKDGNEKGHHMNHNGIKHANPHFSLGPVDLCEDEKHFEFRQTSHENDIDVLNSRFFEHPFLDIKNIDTKDLNSTLGNANRRSKLDFTKIENNTPVKDFYFRHQNRSAPLAFQKTKNPINTNSSNSNKFSLKNFSKLLNNGEYKNQLVVKSNNPNVPSYYLVLNKLSHPALTDMIYEFCKSRCTTINKLRLLSFDLEKKYIAAAALKARNGGICAPDHIISEFEKTRDQLSTTRHVLAQITKDFQFFRKLYDVQMFTKS